jgi:hypothetical protein
VLDSDLLTASEMYSWWSTNGSSINGG